MKKIIIPLLLTTTFLSACGGGTGSDSPTDSNPALAAATLAEPAIAPALPISEVANVAPDAPMSDNDVHRLLTQATYGPTLSDMNALVNTSAEAWIDTQMQLPASYLTQGLANGNQDQWNEYVNVWWRNSINAPDQLRQRVTFALSQILVISGQSGFSEEQYGIANYYDILMRHAFGNFRDLLEDVTLSPIMGEYLSMKGNRKPDAQKNLRSDENYAREIMQLFTIGLEQLNPDGTVKRDADGVALPTYNQKDIENFARVFTGWHFANVDSFRWPTVKDYITPMQSYPEYHDTDEKTLLNGVVIPAGQSPESDLAMALDNLFNHPNVGPFISKQLIQRLVTSNPSPAYVRDVAAVFDSNSAGVRGSLGSTIKAILMHNEARNGASLNPNTFGKVKEPLLRVTNIWRAFKPKEVPKGFNYGWVHNELRQSPINSPTVFNFFRPDFRQAGTLNMQDLATPELQIIDESGVITLTNRLVANTIWSHNYMSDPSSDSIAINIDHEMQLEPDPNQLVNHLDRLLLGGTMSDGLRELTLELINNTNRASNKVVDAIFLIASSPEAAIQR